MWTKAVNPDNGDVEFLGDLSLIDTLPDGRDLYSINWASHKSEGGKIEFLTATEGSVNYTLFNDVNGLKDENTDTLLINEPNLVIK